ncbi:MAG TPA: hypothetical protein VFY14_02660, partial [Streptomyces sp.]|nr:hypothetical protein [Streptomyces sp.]
RSGARVVVAGRASVPDTGGPATPPPHPHQARALAGPGDHSHEPVTGPDPTEPHAADQPGHCAARLGPAGPAADDWGAAVPDRDPGGGVVMTELERLREENAGLRKALLQLRGIYDTAAVMLEHGHPRLDVIRYLEDGVNAAVSPDPTSDRSAA